ncbi:hypothetical protein MO867_15485 [Microbulbifer sp. OS29]|uniref:Sulfotransferase family protein n=1 Tax=Microbulbifer okhotskensis TaxID=2926617 RepID=A0A9X2ETU5_9GAMM|nr:hypothetical protein [Microbulbifer okhotskensis]MCO1335738.1 hypothetical protein [Microbulbifer okhotskensis]
MIIYIHAGLHKTGTTAIQNYAYKYRKILSEKGILYPLIYRSIFRADKAHHHFAHTFSSQKISPPISDAKKLIYSWTTKARRRGLNLLLSAEPFCRHTYKANDSTWIKARYDYLERLASILPIEQIRIILTLRRQDDFVQSLYKENVMKGLTPAAKMDFKEFTLEAQKRNLRFHENILAFKKFFPNVQILIYEQLRNGDLPVNFFRALGISGLPNSEGAIRVSLTNQEVALKRALNHQVCSKEQNNQLLKWLKSPYTQNIIKNLIPKIPSLWISQEERETFLKQYSQENELIRKQFFTNQARLFPPLISAKEALRFSGNIHWDDGIKKSIERLSPDLQKLFGSDGLRQIQKKLSSQTI